MHNICKPLFYLIFHRLPLPFFTNSVTLVTHNKIAKKAFLYILGIVVFSYTYIFVGEMTNKSNIFVKRLNFKVQNIVNTSVFNYVCKIIEQKYDIMKKIFCVLTVMLVALAATVPASAQFKFGLKAGVAVNDLKFNQELMSASNRAGFTGGAMIEFTAPIVGIGLDLSAMYVHRSVDMGIKDTSNQEVDSDSRDYIDIPLNLKWKINIPAVNKIVRPFITTGPSFAFLVSKKDASEFFKNKKCDIAWNFGAGLELFSHVQVSASYGLGMTKALETLKVTEEMPTIEGKNKYWTIAVAYLF